MIIRALILCAATALAGTVPAVHAASGNAQGDGRANPGLAIGQDPRLLQTTRDTNAGAGNGGELYWTCSFTGRAHNMCSLDDRDPGNSGLHNQAPECDSLFCEFDPQG